MAFNESNKNKILINPIASQPYPLPSRALSWLKPKLDKEYSSPAKKEITHHNMWEYEEPLKASSHPKLLILPRPLGAIL